MEKYYAVNLNDFSESFSLAKECSMLVNSRVQSGYKIIIYVLDNWLKVNDLTKTIWIDLIESAGFYPYLDQVQNENMDLSTIIRKGYHNSESLPNIILHREQKELSILLNRNENVILSAPTSFGKSLLIEEVVAKKIYNNIVVIQPTLALLNETRKKLNKYSDEYNIIIKTSQKVSTDKKNLFLLTAERVMEFQNLPNIDFTILDEFYKISSKRDDERSDTLNNAINLLLNVHNSKFYFLAPNIEGISKGFAEKYKAIFYKTEYSLVNNNIIDLYHENKENLEKKGKVKFKKELLFKYLIETLNTGEQNLIYCSSPEKSLNLAKEFFEYLLSYNIILERKNLPIIEWLKKNIHSNWSYIQLLGYGIGAHNGAVPKHVNDSIIDYFNEGEIKFLFCTSTIIEGVNTTAKNVFWYDQFKGGKPIDYFDFSNIRGRAGRLMKHYEGNFYILNPQPPMELTLVDIPFFDQLDISDEVLINLSDKDVKDQNKERYNQLKNINENYEGYLQKNGVSILVQLEIIKVLEMKLKNNPFDKQIIWNGRPEYNSLRFILELGFKLLKPGESKGNMTPASVSVKALKAHLSLKQQIESEIEYLKRRDSENKIEEEKIINTAISNILQAQRHWIQYKVPKFLNTLHNLQIAVCNRLGIENPGDYTSFSTVLENNFIRSDLSILLELGVPSTAIKKISSKIPSDISSENLFTYIKNNKLYNDSALLAYEKKCLRDL